MLIIPNTPRGKSSSCMSCMKLEDDNVLKLHSTSWCTKVGIFQVCALVGMREGRKQTWCNLLQFFQTPPMPSNCGQVRWMQTCRSIFPEFLFLHQSFALRQLFSVIPVELSACCACPLPCSRLQMIAVISYFVVVQSKYFGYNILKCCFNWVIHLQQMKHKECILEATLNRIEIITLLLP